MNEWFAGALIGAVAALVAGGSILLVGLLMPRRRCPDCGEMFPRFRKPANRRQALWGGGTCVHCGCDVDRRGRRITTQK